MKYTEFTFIDYLFSTVWLLIFTVIVYYIKEKNRTNPLYKYFIHAYVYKLIMGLLFAVVYLYVYGGGDTIAYWEGSDILNKLFYESPSSYFSEIWRNTSENKIMPSCYNIKTGYPPVWIYFEPNSWFVSKFSSFISFFSFGSYLVLNLIFSFLSFIISFRFYLFVNRVTSIKSNLILIAIMFIPSASFWCGGISKDTIVYIFCLIAIMSFWKLIYEKFNLLSLIIFLFSAFILIQSRAFVLLAIVSPLLIILVFRLNRHKSFITRVITRSVGISLTVIAIGLFINYSSIFGEFSISNIVNTAEITYNDFQVNEKYTGKRYDLEMEDFSTPSLIKVFPKAVFTAIYRPYIWEAESVLMLLNGLESILLIVFSIQLLRKTKFKKSTDLNTSTSTQDFIIFCISFVLILGFFVGLTSVLFGVLSRLKSLLLPFFTLFLFNRMREEKFNKLTEK
jgi:hypothetical protein